MFDPRTRKQRYLQLAGTLKTERASFDSHWQELGEYLAPRRTRFFAGDRNRGDRRNHKIIDSTARFSLRTLQSGMHAGLTSPARPWFKLTTPDPELAEFRPVKEWLHQVTQRMQIVFADSNLYNSLPIVYGDLGAFGTASMAILQDTPQPGGRVRDLFRCFTFPVGSYHLGLDGRNLVTTFVREYQLTVRQAVERFGVRPGFTDIDWGRFSRTVKDSWDRGNYELPVNVTWVVLPNEKYNADRLGSEYLPWASCHFEQQESEDGRFLLESGFSEFPIMAPRWDITGEDAYGTDCPGMTALGDVKGLQIMQREKAKAIAKMVSPPIIASPELRTQKTSILPGDITYAMNPEKAIKAIHETTINVEHLVRDIGETQYRIQRAFYEDLFLMMASSDARNGADRPTAREVEERHEEKLLALGPVLERTNDELLDPIVDRVYAMMDAEGLIPPPPEELEGVAIKVEYISIMAQAQKLVGVVGQDRFVASMMPLAEGFPEIRHKINVNRIVDNYGEMLGIDPRIIRDDKDAEARAAAEAEAQRAAMEAEQAKLLAGAAKDASQAPVEGGGTMLDQLMGAGGAGMVN